MKLVFRPVFSIAICVLAITSCTRVTENTGTEPFVEANSCLAEPLEKTPEQLFKTVNISFLSPQNTLYSADEINKFFPIKTMDDFSHNLKIEFKILESQPEPKQTGDLQIEIIDFVLKQPGNKLEGPKSSNIVFFEYGFSRENIDFDRYRYPANLLSRLYRQKCKPEQICNELPSEVKQPQGRFDPRLAGFLVYESGRPTHAHCFLNKPKNAREQRSVNEYTLRVTECIFRALGVLEFANETFDTNFYSPRHKLTTISNRLEFEQAFDETIGCILNTPN